MEGGTERGGEKRGERERGGDTLNALIVVPDCSYQPLAMSGSNPFSFAYLSNSLLRASAVRHNPSDNTRE